MGFFPEFPGTKRALPAGNAPAIRNPNLPGILKRTSLGAEIAGSRSRLEQNLSRSSIKPGGIANRAGYLWQTLFFFPLSLN